MSYLGFPRLHFFGAFIANPSTVNNWAPNFSPQVSSPRPSWNPDGSGGFSLTDCAVQRAVLDASAPGAGDPVVGATLSSTNQPVQAKIVDLDPQQQLVSELYGLQIRIAADGRALLTGDFEPVCFDDIWFQRMQGGGAGDMGASAFYQSVLKNLAWGDVASSPFLSALRNRSPDQLSIKFMVDRFVMNPGPSFTKGRVVGSIGPASAGEPINFLAGRILRPSENSDLFYGYAQVDAQRRLALFDLGNSIPTNAGGTPDLPLGDLQAAIMPAEASPVLLGRIDTGQAAYQATAGIQAFALSDQQVAQLDETPLGVVRMGPAGQTTTLLKENETGSYLNATRFVYRLNPGESAEVELLALAFGRPKANQTIMLGNDPARLGVQPPTWPPVGVPAAALKLPKRIKTGADGRACFTLTAGDPRNRRRYIDGQVYAVAFFWAAEDDPDFPPDPSSFLSVLVHDRFDAAPTWANIAPFMQQYAKLYPFMDKILQLDDPAALKAMTGRLEIVFNLPITDPRHMPVTRDLSRDKKQAILDWLRAGAPIA